jgi:hypothetical protein
MARESGSYHPVSPREKLLKVFKAWRPAAECKIDYGKYT